MTQIPSIRDRLLLALLRAVPKSIAAHACFLLRSHPTVADKWGYHVRPIHYYEPLPDFSAIAPEATLNRYDRSAICFRVDAQIETLEHFGERYASELLELQTQFDFKNEYFAGLDAAAYYSFIRDRRPRRVVEIGSGFSTRIAAYALKRNSTLGFPGELVCIEPYPQSRLTQDAPAMRLIQKPVQDVDLSLFAALEAGDILFIDSSHAVKYGSDVCFEFLRILPCLRPGVLVHVHDIFFPHDYPADWLVNRRISFAEQYLLEAFLAFNSSYSVELANYWMCLEHASIVSRLCPEQLMPPAPHGGGSFWMSRNEESDG